MTASSLAAAAELPPPTRVRIYQVLPRLFGNTNETRKPNGTLAENGVGKFNDLNDAALDSLQAMGFTHLWLTGVLRQMTATDYPAIGLTPDDPDLLKGLAGSPYAIKDYFDLCPDLAVDPAHRLDEFKALLARLHARGLKAIIDFVPNHVGRAYASSVRPELSFGKDDDRTRFFAADNNFFYLRPTDPGGGAPLRLPTLDAQGQPVSPTCRVLGAGDGRFDGEREFGRVTGNNVVSWAPMPHDWYETVKLNYGFDFTDPAKRRREYPHGSSGPDAARPVPDTWKKMDAVLAHWQALGVDGFRCDMAHLIPPEFWRWAIARARERQPDVYFVAEAYDDDPAKVPAGDGKPARNVMVDLLDAGFDSVYDDPSLKILKGIYDGPKWANDLDDAHGGGSADPARANLFHRSLRHAENHDEVRLASRGNWGNVGPEVGRPVAAILYALGRGPAMLYSGQEVGEPAAGAEGFGGDDGRTSIFDYWSMPELAKWVNGGRYDGGRLSPAQRDLREFYGRLLHLVGEPAFTRGEFIPLNPANNGNPRFGRLPGETASGHWLYAFLRDDPASRQRFLVVVNLHPRETFLGVEVRIPVTFRPPPGAAPAPPPRDRLGDTPAVWRADSNVVELPALPPLTPCFLELPGS